MTGMIVRTGGGGGAPSGAAGGALGGTYPNPTLAAGTVTNGGLVWDGANWVNAKLVDANIAAGAAIAESKLSLATDAAAGTGSRRTLGYGAAQAAPGPDVALQVLPRHHGFLAWTYDPLLANSFSGVSAAATLILSKVMVPATISVSTVTTFIAANGTTLTNSYLGVYSSAGVLLGSSSADQSTVWNAGAPKAIATPVSVGTITGGTDVFVWVAFQVGSGTSPTFARALPGGSGSGVLLATIGQTNTNADAATIASGNAALPGSFAPGSAAAAGAVRLWAALS